MRLIQVNNESLIYRYKDIVIAEYLEGLQRQRQIAVICGRQGGAWHTETDYRNTEVKLKEIKGNDIKNRAETRAASNLALELNECHRTLFRHVVGLRSAKWFLSKLVRCSGTRHSALRYPSSSLIVMML